jgi:hypothetical protein
MTVRTNPPGATVYLDGKEIGRTPFSTNFNHYGNREFRVVKQGYETKTVVRPVKAPWYEWVGLDFVSEVLLPGKLTDQRYYEFDMEPEKVVPGSEIVARAEELRQTAHADGLPHVVNSTPQPVTPSMSGTIAPFSTPSFAPIQPPNSN